jgi:segregation and condensation protein B
MRNQIEALIFAADSPLTIDEIGQCITKLMGLELTNEQIEEEVTALIKKYDEGDFAFRILPIAGGYQFFTKSDFDPIVSEYIKNKLNKRLSTGQLETLSIIAYKQPISKPEIEQIRGVNCDYAIHKLLEKELVAISGRSEGVGKAIQYSISPYFLNYFGLNSTDELPKLKDITASSENMIGVPLESQEVTTPEYQPAENADSHAN